jgi:hypothetical protein
MEKPSKGIATPDKEIAPTNSPQESLKVPTPPTAKLFERFQGTLKEFAEPNAVNQ